MKIHLKFWQVDSFASEPFKGNPAAVFILQEQISDELMQSIAIEMNLSETAFVLLREGQNPLLRWFTPTVEIDLCGHATLASAHIYMTEIVPDAKDVTFDTKFVGPLSIERSGSSYTMNFPSRPGEKVDVEDIPNFVLDALSTEKPIEAYKARDLMLVYRNEKIIRDIKPDFNALMKHKDYIIVTAPSADTSYDFVSRFFCADDGIAEDPVTGSAHCTSAPYWATKLGIQRLTAYQASKRGGDLVLEMLGDRVLIAGKAITIIDGNVRV